MAASLASRFFHTLVISSVVALEGAGCTLAHESPPPAPPDDDPDGGARADAGHTVRRDAGFRVDAGFDAGTDAGFDAGHDGGFDAGAPDGGDLRMCDDGWPTTKGFFCTTQDEIQICCNTIRLPDGGEDCCVLETE